MIDKTLATITLCTTTLIASASLYAKASELDQYLVQQKILSADSLYTTNFTEPLSYQDSAFLKLPKFP